MIRQAARRSTRLLVGFLGWRSPAGRIVVDPRQSSIPGVFAAGDAAQAAMQVIVAAGEGSAAGIGINEYLTDLP